MSEEVKKKSVPVSTIHLTEGHPMAEFVDAIPMPPTVGDLVEGTVIAINRGRVYIDLPPFGTGIIYGREYLNAADVLRKTNEGDIISAKIIDPAGRDGYIELSLKEARQAAIWEKLNRPSFLERHTLLLLKKRTREGLFFRGKAFQDSFRLHSFQRNIILECPRATKIKFSVNS